jgi:chromosome partitioning protein
MEMATVVTIMNMKGGVGKTTATVNIGGFLSRYYFDGKKPLKTLVIDYDPQFNLSQSFLASKKYFKLESDYKTTLSILVDDANTLNAYKLLVPGNHSPPKVADLATTVFKKKWERGWRPGHHSIHTRPNVCCTRPSRH